MNYFIFSLIPIGLLAGLFINYLADVLPLQHKLAHPACPNCQAPYSLMDYLMLRACRGCGKKRGWRSWIVLILIPTAMVYFHYVPPIFFKPPGQADTDWTGILQPEYWAGIVWLIYLGVVFVIDLEHRLILHVTSLFGAILGLGIGIYIQGIKLTLIGGTAGLVIMLVIYMLGIAITRLRAHRMTTAGLEADDEEAFGFGDVLLGWILGMVYGWPLTLGGLFLGILFAGVVSILIVVSLLVRRRYKEQVMMIFIPFGPCLIASAVLLLYFPNWTMY